MSGWNEIENHRAKHLLDEKRQARRRAKICLFIQNLLAFLMALLFVFHVSAVRSAAVPPDAKPYQRTLTRTAHAHWGLDAPVALFAAQIHQESRWQVDARSPAGAEGLAQFMPATSEWFAQINPRDLTTAQPYNPAWAMRAMVLYDAWLFNQIAAHNPCEQWAFALSAYNGGLAWVNRDKVLASASGADGLAYFDSVEKYNAGRSAASITENRHYVRAVIGQWQPVYRRAGWGLGVCNDR